MGARHSLDQSERARPRHASHRLAPSTAVADAGRALAPLAAAAELRGRRRFASRRRDTAGALARAGLHLAPGSCDRLPAAEASTASMGLSGLRTARSAGAE